MKELVLTTYETQPTFYSCHLNKPVNKAELLNALQSFLPLAVCAEKPLQSPIETIAEPIEKPVNPELLALLISDYQEQINKLNSSGGYDISTIIEVAEQLLEIAQQYQCRQLADWASALKNQAELFDIENLPETLASFEALIQQLDK